MRKVMPKSALILLLYAPSILGQLAVAPAHSSIGKQCPTNPKCSTRFHEGGYCSPRVDSDFCTRRTDICKWGTSTDKLSSLVSHLPWTPPCYCCRNCKDVHCSKWRDGYQCVNSTTAKENLALGAQCITHQVLCKSAKGQKCSCCSSCLDVGCSRLGHGYNCRTEKEAATWPMPCKKSKKYCKNLGGFDIAMTVDNSFKLYNGPPPTAPGSPGAFIGSGNDWHVTYTFSSGGPAEYLTVYGHNDGSPDRGIILSTSTGLVTDESWKCIDAKRAKKVNYRFWPNAKVVGVNGDTPWGFRSGIDPSAKWIWADPRTPNDVVCYKEIRCFCCPD